MRSKSRQRSISMSKSRGCVHGPPHCAREGAGFRSAGGTLGTLAEGEIKPVPLIAAFLMGTYNRHTVEGNLVRTCQPPLMPTAEADGPSHFGLSE
jgi:hypothetical protein